MKNFGLLFALIIGMLSGCAYVDPGNVGIRVNLYGSNRGVEDYPLVSGRVLYNPMTQSVYEYPTYMQNIVWTKDVTEGSPTDESISFNSSEGANLNVDIGVSYSLQADKVPAFFVKFRQTIDVVSHGYLRNKVRDAVVRAASQHKAAEIFGSKKQEMLTEILDHVNGEVKEFGFNIDNISFISEIRCEDRVKQSINSVIEASQLAMQAENKIKQIEAEAKQQIAKSEGMAEATIKAAEAKAQAAKLEAAANKELSQSLTPALIQYRMLERWDGVAPKVMSGESNQLLLQVEDK